MKLNWSFEDNDILCSFIIVTHSKILLGILLNAMAMQPLQSISCTTEYGRDHIIKQDCNHCVHIIIVDIL